MSPHWFCCCDLGRREPLKHRQEACLLTQLSVCADFTSHPPAVLAALNSNPPLLPFPHLALLFSSCWIKSLSPTTIFTYLTSLPPLSLSSSCASRSLSICLFHPLHPSSVSSPSRLSLSNPGRLVAWLFWQPSVELIHEPVLGQCNQPLFVAYY